MRVGLYNGVFDLFHEGHLHALEEAGRQCDYLVVAVNTDASVRRLKGPKRPVDTLYLRILHIEQHKLVDAVIPFDGDRDTLIMAIKPQVVFVGYDHSAPIKLAWYAKGWKDGGDQAGFADVIQLSHLPGFSTTGSLRA